VFLGLLGTFWGLIETVGSVGKVIEGLKVGGDAGSLFDTLKEGLAAPLGGMGISFSSSLFGLAGSLILGFLDLQSSQAQNRFYTDLEDWLASTVREYGGEGVGVSSGWQDSPRRVGAKQWPLRVHAATKRDSTTGRVSSTRCRRWCSRSCSCFRCFWWCSSSCRRKSPARTRRWRRSTQRSRS